MIKKSELNPNIHLSEGNIKSKETDSVAFLTWSIPSRITCPYATEECKKRCFAKKRELNFPKILNSRKRNFEETLKPIFVQDMIKHLEYHLNRKKMENKKIFVRIHTSGDFYNLEYLYKWSEIAKHFKDNDKILFQAYTKSIRHLWNWIVGEENEDFIDDGDVRDAFEELNIHFVYSIWHDTLQADINLAENIGLQTFTALPKGEVELAVESGAFRCNGDCGNCRECYTGISERIVIPYH